MSHKTPLCESVCPQCKREVEFEPVHPLQVERDCFLGSYLCKCNTLLMMDYEVASQSFIARTYEAWMLQHKKQFHFGKALELVKKSKKVTRAAWDEGSYLYLGENSSAYQIEQKNVPVLIVHYRGDDYYYAYASDFDMSDDLLAEDWMLYEETPNEH
ncbi:Thoeris anti-defense Tad2 family protein [Psychrobacter sp. T6-1]|uniref:Thoeris anti-defense Tad2 family protein n=1 Tax=Psychrobacter sp. T6-1 TaxID=3457447 RepID=UPI003FD635C5